MNKEKNKQLIRIRRKARVQARGTANRPRLSVFRSLKSIYAQLIDDVAKKTLVFASANEIGDNKLNKEDTAKEVGKLLAKKAKEKNVIKVIFDKGSYKYHGRVKALADGAREGGLEF